MRFSEEKKLQVIEKVSLIVIDMIEEVQKDHSKMETYLIDGGELASRLYKLEIVKSPKAHLLMGMLAQQVFDFFPKFLAEFSKLKNMTTKEKIRVIADRLEA